MAQFPSIEFFSALRERIGAERARFVALGMIDVTFGVRVLRLDGRPPVMVVLAFETFACKEVQEASADTKVPERVDFVLEAPIGVWLEMLQSLDVDRVDAAHSLNTLTHYDHPIHVLSTDPLGHDKLFRFQESIQQVFDLMAQQHLAS
jgi:hypothetical protein